MHPRVFASHLLRVTTCDNFSNVLCNLVDISESGLRFIARHKPQTGSRVQLLVNLSEENKNISVSARVVWARATGFNSYHVGVQFMDADYHCIETIRNFVMSALVSRAA